MLTDRDPDGRLVGNAVMDGVAAALGSLAAGSSAPPSVVFNGDALELALAPTHVALDVFDQFVRRLLEVGESCLSPRLHLLPGNHDHDLWRMSRDEVEAQAVESAPPGEPIPATPPVTPMLDSDVRSDLLTRMLRHRNPGYPDLEVMISSPTAALTHDDRVLALHHGHFTEGVYVAMSQLTHRVYGVSLDEITPSDLERDNGAWIDFLWSSLGREGSIGDSLRRSYDLLNTADGRVLLASRLGAAAEGGSRVPVLRTLRRGVAGLVALRILDAIKDEELRANAPDLPVAATGLVAFLDGPLARQLDVELPRRGVAVPQELTFLYGHTHKPYASSVVTDRFPGGVRVYNSGGWVVDAADPRPSDGGTVLVVGDDLDVALVHLADQADDPGALTGTVEHAEGPECTSPLVAELRERIAADPEPWDHLAAAARDATARRRRERAQGLVEEFAAAEEAFPLGVTSSQIGRLLRRQDRHLARHRRKLRPQEARAWLAGGRAAARHFFTRRRSPR